MKNRYLYFSLTALAVLSLPSCFKINEDYDLDKEIDPTIKILDNLQFPVGNTEFIKLKDIIQIDDDVETIAVDDNGDYCLHFAGGSFSKSYTVPHFALDDYSSELSTFSFDGGYYAAASFSGKIPDMLMNIEIDESDIPVEFKGIRSAELDATVSIHLSLDNAPSSLSFTIQSGSTLELPEWVVVSEWDKTFFDKSADNVLSFKSSRTVTSSSPIDIILKVNRLDFTKLPEGQGVVEPGHVVLQDYAVLSGSYVAGVTTAGTYSPFRFVSQCSLSGMSFKSADVVFNPEIPIDVNRFDIGSIPDIFDSGNCLIDIYDVYFYFDVKSNLPFSCSLNASVSTLDDNWSEIAKVCIGDRNGAEPFVVPAYADNVFCLSEHGSGQLGLTEYIVPGMSRLISRIPYSVDFSDLYLCGNDEYVTIPMDYDSEMSVAYWIDAPLAFGPLLQLTFENDAQIDLDLEDFNVSELTIKADIVNTIPLSFALFAQVTDYEGNPVSGITAEVSADLKPGLPLDPSTSPVTIRLSKTDASVKTIENLHFTFKASASDQFAGVPLNENQGIQIVNMSAHIPGGIIIDTSED